MALQPVVLPGTNDAFAKISALEISVPDRAYETLKQVFGITPSELMTVRDMMEGMSGAEIARARDVREDTVKKQLRAIRDKTGANGRTALISLVASLSHLEGDLERKRPQLSITNVANRVYTMGADHRLVSIGGLRVEYLVQGKPGGKPVLNLHAAFSGYRLPEALAAALGNAGYAIYTPLRPDTEFPTRCLMDIPLTVRCVISSPSQTRWHSTGSPCFRAPAAVFTALG